MKAPFTATEVTPVPPAGEMCEDCAFKPGSPERCPTYAGVSLAQVKELTEAFLEAGFPPQHPFFCHAGMEPNGRGGYHPWPDPRDPRWRVCEGWKRTYGPRIERLEE